MLDRAHRITRSEDFAVTVRRGRRSGSPVLVVQLLQAFDAKEPAKVGFVVGKRVGNAVTRNQVKRRLRHLVRDRLGALPAGSLLVVRALGPAAGQSPAVLARELDRRLDKVLSPGGPR